MTDPPAPPLAALAPLLAEEPALRAVIARDPVVAVPDAARALFVAALARVTTRRPLLLAVPTGAEAERLVHDLGQFLGDGRGRAVPRVGDAAVRAGVAVARDDGPAAAGDVAPAQPGDRRPSVVVAPVRALVQRLGPHVEAVEPVVVRPGDQVDRDELVERLVAGGYRREYQVEARGEVAVRGSIVDVYPSTDDHPVRIDLWGDEVDRLSGFAVADQRSTHDVAEACIFPARELLPTRRGARAGRGAGRRAAVGPRAVGAPRRGPDLRRHGVVAAVALRPRAPAARPAARRRARAAGRAPAHARPRPGAARRRGVAGVDRSPTTWGAGDRDRPAASLARVRPAARAHRRGRGVAAVGTRRSRHAARRRDRVRSGGRRRRRARPPPAHARAATATASCSRPRAPARRTGSATSSPARGSTLARWRTCARRDAPRRRADRPRRGAPGRELALVAEADLTGRRRVHRRRARRAARARLLRRPQARRLRRAPPARRRPLPGDEAAHDGRRRARLPLARVQGRQGLRADRPGRDWCASTPAARRRRSTAWAAPTSRSSGHASAARCARSPRSSSCSTGSGSRRPDAPSAPTRRGSTRWRRRSRSRRRPTRCRRSST